MRKNLFFTLIFILALIFNLQPPVYGDGPGTGRQEFKKELSLNDCINLALKNNLDIKIEEFNPEIGRKNIEVEKSFFDKNLTFELNKSYSRRASSSTLQGSTAPETEGLNLSVGISQKLYSGTNYTLQVNSQRQESNSTFSTLNPYYQSDMTLSLTHPLMQGKGTDINKTKIKISNIEFEISNLTLKQKIIDVINLVEVAYYNLLFAKENLEVKEKALQSSLDFEKEIKEKAKYGLLPKSDILPAQAKTASKEAELIEAKANYQKAKDNLIILIYPETNYKDIIIGDLPEISYEVLDIDKEKEDAFLNRPDYNILKKNLVIQDINLRFTKNQKLPNLDLVSNFGANGLRGNLGGTFEDIGNTDYYNYQIGVQLKYPLGNREAKEKYQKEKMEMEKIIYSLKSMEIKIIKDVNDAITDVKTAKERLKAEKKATELSFQNLQQEREKFRLGLSTTFNVLQYEDEYNSAKVGELKTIIDYNIAVSNLSKVTGKNILKWRK